MNRTDIAGKWEVRLLGTRGSMAVTDDEHRKYGGDTLCIQIGIGDKSIFLDAGTGIMHGRALSDNHILIGHPHLDHLIGLGKWTELADPTKKMRIYMAEHEGMGCADVLHRMYGPPFWPIALEVVSRGLEYVTITEKQFFIDEVRVETLAGNHPGGVTHYKLSDGKRSLVYAVDSELTQEAFEELADFAGGCDLLICDGQLMEEDVATKRGWGHSTIKEAATLGMTCGAKETVLVHYDPQADDEMLDGIANRMKSSFPKCSFGKQGEIRYL